MTLRVVCPTKRAESDNWYYRRTIPADVQRILYNHPKAVRPNGWYRTHISISLRTLIVSLQKQGGLRLQPTWSASSLNCGAD